MPKNSKTIFATPQQSVDIKNKYKIDDKTYPQELLKEMLELPNTDEVDLIIFTGDKSKSGAIIHASPNCTDGISCTKHEDRCVISFDVE